MHYVINVKAEKLERFYVEVMFPFGSRSPLSQFQTKLRLWFRRENFMSFHDIKKVKLKRNFGKKSNTLSYPREVQHGDFNLRKSLSMPSLTL